MSTAEDRSPVRGNLAGAGTALGGQLLNGLYYNSVLGSPQPHLVSKVSDPSDSLRFLSGKPLGPQYFSFGDSVSQRIAYGEPRAKAYAQLLKNFGKDAPELFAGGPTPAAYLPANNAVVLNPGIKDPSGHVLAHELGHAKQRGLLQSKAFMLSRPAGMLGNSYGLLGALFRKSDDDAKRDALIGAAGLAPTLGVELDASRRGSQMMRQLAEQNGTWSSMSPIKKLLFRLGAFRGVPTYGLVASLPMLAYAARKRFGSFGADQTYSDRIANFFKQSSAQKTASRDEARGVLDKIYRENPSHWPYGLTPDHFDGGLYLIRKNASEEPVGFAGWQERFERTKSGLRKVGYYSIGILPEHRRKGFAKEALQKFIQTKSASVDVVRALVMASNKPSLELASKLPVETQVKYAKLRQMYLAGKGK